MINRIVEKMLAKDYHATTGLSSSVIKALHTSPAHVQIPREEISDASQRAMDIGTIAHAIVLEGSNDLAALGMVAKPDGMKLNTKAGIAWKEEQDALGLRPIDAKAVATATATASAVLSDDIARNELGEPQNRKAELSLFCVCYGQPMKARLDMLNLETMNIIDLKTCQDASPDAFARDCDNRGYLLQAAHYIRIAKMCGLNVSGFRFIAASTNAPHEVAVYDFNESHPSWVIVNDRLDYLYDLHLRCMTSNQWPKRSWLMEPIRVPHYSKFAVKLDAIDLDGIETE